MSLKQKLKIKKLEIEALARRERTWRLVYGTIDRFSTMKLAAFGLTIWTIAGFGFVTFMWFIYLTFKGR